MRPVCKKIYVIAPRGEAKDYNLVVIRQSLSTISFTRSGSACEFKFIGNYTFQS